MRGFIKQLLSVILGNAIFFGLFLLTFVLILIGIASSKEDKVTIHSDSVLKISINDALNELPSNQEDIFSIMNEDRGTSLHEIIESIEKAKDDDKIKALYLELNLNSSLSYSQIDLLRNAIQNFNNSKKSSIAYGEVCSQKMYYLASACNKIFLNPIGMVDFRGFGAEITFFKKTLDKLEITPQVFYAGKFKSATEPFRYEKMSEENKIQTKELLMDIKNNVWQEISKARKIPTDSIDYYVNNLLLYNSENLKKYNFIDNIYYQDEVETYLKKITESKDKISFIDIETYHKEIQENKKNPIAIYIAEGNIMDGEAEEGSIGSINMVEDLKKIQNDDKIKGVVLRINSPGGSALASDVILREIENLQKKKKVVVSMGNVAASGGYYIASSADKIFAEKNTITGSIGVFSIIPNFQKLFENKLGITFDEVELNDHAIMGLNKPFDDTESKYAQIQTEQIYTRFKSIVGKGRKLHTDSVENIAQGRVWSGEKARKIGLVDQIGTLQDAINYVAKETNSEAKAYVFNTAPSFFDKIKKQKGLIQVFKSYFTEILLGKDLAKNITNYQEVVETNLTKKSIQMKMYFDLKM
jgi:protease-4